MSEDKLGAAAVIIAVVSKQKNIKNAHRRKRKCWVKPWHVRNIAFRINSSLSDVPVFIFIQNDVPKAFFLFPSVYKFVCINFIYFFVTQIHT